jgi:hypothetical protein
MGRLGGLWFTLFIASPRLSAYILNPDQVAGRGRDCETESEKVALIDLRCHPTFYARDATETAALQEASAG